MELAGLIAKVERVQEGSRELDATIWALDAATPRPLEFGHEQYTESAYREWVRCGSLGEWMDNIPHYTTSVDAASQLVPKGWIWDVTSTGQAWAMPDESREERMLRDFVGRDRQVIARAATPALALCAASLRAREPQEE